MIAPLIALLLFQQPEAQCRSCDTLTRMAAALSQGNSVRFMEFIDKSTPGYSDIESNVNALVTQQDVSASLDILDEKGDDSRVEALVDWFMQFTARDDSVSIVRRRMRVKITAQHEVRTEKGKSLWKIVSIDPRSILEPVTIAPGR